jgi:hypothetical protein
MSLTYGVSIAIVAIELTAFVAGQGKRVDNAARVPIPFADGSCDSPGAERACVDYKSWTPNEKSVVAAVLADIEGLGPEGRNLIQRANLNTLRRRGPLEDPAIYAFTITGPAERFVTFLDRFFEQPDLRDLVAGYRLQTQRLLHELFHALDMRSRSSGRVSDSVAFQRWAGFDARGRFASAVASQVNREIQRVNSLNDSGQIEAAWNLDRSGGMKIGLPTLAAAQSPRESFAEIGSHLLLDPKGTRRMLRSELVQFFEDRVFVLLR